MKTIFSVFILSLFISISHAQQPYTQAQYGIDSIIDLQYGTANNYAGTPVDLYLDLYKPVGDGNCKRPIILLAHGGAWVTDSKENASMQFMSRELAKRGWVVANIDYRLGTNKADDYTSSAICANFTEPCAFICDSMEVERANYRAMQDAKGAIRFMKSRHLIDSSDIDNVYMAGESAGGFISLSTGFTLNPNQKPASCLQIGDAPTPDADLAALPCSDPANDLSRPDLGDIEGTLHLGTYNSELQGVGSFFGGAIDLAIFNQVQNGPGVYLFGQGSDVIIHYDYGVMFDRISNECLSGICPAYGPYPHAYGAEGIRKHLDTLAGAPMYQADIVANFNQGGNCLDNGHQIDDPMMRLQSMTDFFASIIATSGNTGQGTCAVGIEEVKLDVSVLQNPFSENIQIRIGTDLLQSEYLITDLSGKRIRSGLLSQTTSTIDAGDLSAGLYLLNLRKGDRQTTIKLIKQP